MRTGTKSLWVIALLFLATSAVAQELDDTDLELRIEAPVCLPNRGFAPITVQLPSDENVSAVRIYFRRLNPLGSFYYLEMNRVGNAIYSTLLPEPADRAQQELDDTWWSALSLRDWLGGRDREWLAEWLDRQQHEAVELFIAVADVYGDRIGQSKTQLLEVRDSKACPVQLTPREQEWADGIAIGETTEAQVGLPPFHWTCRGISDRISIDGRVRPDRSCMTGGGGG